MPDTTPSPNTHTQHQAPGKGGFRSCWLAETLRLRENLWGPLEDASEVRRARAEGGSFTEKLLRRAHYLGQREHLDQVLSRWSGMAKLSLLIMAVAALLAGLVAALGALGDGGRSVNIMLALVALLGLNTLTFLFWLLSFVVVSGQGGSWLGECWLWLTRRLARGPDAALAPRALVELLSRHNALRWTLGGISHALWTLALACAVMSMLAVLSTRRYSFNWETTLLSPDTFVAVTTALGWLPSTLGFSIPSPELILASDGLQRLPEPAQALWSSWLIGCVVVYALLPRLIALMLSLFMARKRLANLQLDSRLPGYAELQDRLSPASERAGIDQPDGADTLAIRDAVELVAVRPGQPLLVGIELAPDVPWPPPGLSPAVANFGVIDSSNQRKALLDRLQQSRPTRLLLICDARQTPDRGTIALLTELASFAQDTRIALLRAPASSQSETRTETWRERLQAAGFPPQNLTQAKPAALLWLAGEPDPPPAAATGEQA
ncbi:DUF2868 domain-containing protein [Allopusillimonas ginsengisoli]|uniref:DUF2868 domain-containing protein n=1 Tax=Allopusillimonas ginsengisoli TaxID=453575 RepID=UPI001021791E|nr:DUF2868 domain-containing protein [Allopusillimonas ginsengisoli]TEA77059.1 DUF2868 domain-containing protein [Allopusillimonas ginsengisoli]